MEQGQEEENKWCDQKNIPPNNPIHGSSLRTDNNSSEESSSIWISMQLVVFFEIIVCENRTFCLM